MMEFTGDVDFDNILNKCVEILKVKGEDYTLGTGRRTHNFHTVAEFTGMTPEQVLGVYLYKHVSSLFSYIKSGGQRESEPIEERLCDIINYCLLCSKLISEKKQSS